MLVPSMTLSEIRRELDKDFPIVHRKGEYLLEDLKRISRRTRVENIVKFYDYYSKQKNNWIIRVETLKKGGYMGCLAYYYGNSGLVCVIKLANDDHILYHTAHFFKRFNERLHLNLTNPNDIMRAYLNENPSIQLKAVSVIKPGFYSFFSASPHGYGLGTCDQEQKFYKMNTFITHDMLRGDQIDRAEYLNSLLREYLPNAGNLH